MNKYSSNTSFIDKLYILLCLFVLQFIIAFLHINPVAKEGIIDPETKLMVVMKWPELSVADIDLWAKGPDGSVVGYVNKDKKYMILERDDLGVSNDTIVINGKKTVIQRNIEMMTFNELPKGEYVINVHNYPHGFRSYESDFKEEPAYPIPVTIEIMKINPFSVIIHS